MESLEIFLYVFLVSHYTFNIAFVSWVFSQSVPIDLADLKHVDNYGLLN